MDTTLKLQLEDLEELTKPHFASLEFVKSLNRRIDDWFKKKFPCCPDRQDTLGFNKDTIFLVVTMLAASIYFAVAISVEIFSQ